MTDAKVLAYLKSLYPYASDTFVRLEIQKLRELGYQVHAFSVRRPPAEMLVSPDIMEEQERTLYLLDRFARLILAGITTAMRSPLRMCIALHLAMATSIPGVKGRLKQVAYLFEAALLSRWMRAKGVQHLHNHIGGNSASVAMLASVLSGIPYSLTVHGPKEFDRPEFLALGQKIRRALFTVAVSEFGRGQLYRWCGHDSWGKIHVVHCGVDEALLRSEAVPIRDVSQFVCVGRLCPEKGQLLLVEAVHRLRETDTWVEIALVGDGPARGDVETLIARYDLGDRIRLLGWMSSERVREEILASRALVLPSLAEGLPVVIMEALALRRPVISTYIAGIPELVQPGVCGWLIPSGSVEALAKSIRQVLQTPVDVLAEMGRKGAEMVAQSHDGSVETRKLARLYERAITWEL